MDHVLHEGANQSSETLIRKNEDICQILKELSQGEVSFLLLFSGLLIIFLSQNSHYLYNN